MQLFYEEPSSSTSFSQSKELISDTSSIMMSG
jgi:hypothetical protein